MFTSTRRALLGSLLAVLTAACAAATDATPGPTIISVPTPPGTLDGGELRLLLIDRLGPRWYCDPDSFPVGRDEQQSAIERFPRLAVEDRELFEAVVSRIGIDLAGDVSNADKLSIWRQWKVGASIQLQPVGEGRYRFDYLAQPVAGAAQGMRTAGLIDTHGAMTVDQQAAAGEPICPICLARSTTIDTPEGPIPVDRLRLGDQVWTLDDKGRRVPGTVIALGSTDAPAGHQVVELRLADGRSVTASPGHPLADGRLLGELAIGDVVDGSAVVGWELVAYGGDATFDLVVSGVTGTYLAGGIPLGTTLR